MSDIDLELDRLLEQADELYRKQTHSFVHKVLATVVCKNCQTIYKGTIKLGKNWFDNKSVYYITYYCPRCPKLSSLETWLKDSLGIDGPTTFESFKF